MARFQVQEDHSTAARAKVFSIWDLQGRDDGLRPIHYGPIIGAMEAEQLAELLNSFDEQLARKDHD